MAKASKAKLKTKAVPAKETGSASAVPETSKLTHQQRAFVEEYLTCWNATDAAKRAKYSEKTARTQGSHLLTLVDITEAIQKRLKEKAMSADEVLERIAIIARGSLQPFVKTTEEDVWPDLTTESAQANFGLLKKIKPKRRTGGKPGDEWQESEIEIEIHDPLKALELLGRNHKLFTDNHDLSSSDGSMTPTGYQFVPYIKPENDSSDSDTTKTD